MPPQLYRFVAIGQILPGATGSQTGTVNAVLKSNLNDPYCVPNELICARVGQFLGLPIPAGGIVQSPSAQPPFWYGSFDFNLTGVALPPADPLVCVQRLPDESTGLVVFDILIANSDRHAGNLAVDLTQAPRMSVFDHSHALFGAAPGQGIARLQQLRDSLGITGAPPTFGNRHCLLDHLTSDRYFDKWLSRVEALPDFLVQDVCTEAIDVGATAEEAQEAVAFLLHRRGQLRGMISSNRAQFRGIQQWSLM